jgi:hypothetical protein
VTAEVVIEEEAVDTVEEEETEVTEVATEELPLEKPLKVVKLKVKNEYSDSLP